MHRAESFWKWHEIPRTLWNPTFQYRVHNSSPIVLILSHIKPVDAPRACSCKTPFNIVLLSMPRSPKWSLAFRIPHQKPVCVCVCVCVCALLHTCPMFYPSYSSGVVYPHLSNQDSQTREGEIWQQQRVAPERQKCPWTKHFKNDIFRNSS